MKGAQTMRTTYKIQLSLEEWDGDGYVRLLPGHYECLSEVKSLEEAEQRFADMQELIETWDGVLGKNRLFQVISRDNDINGNPYRLVFVYDEIGSVSQVFEARSSSPNISQKLRKDGLIELPSFHLSPAEYNQIRKYHKRRTVHED